VCAALGAHASWLRGRTGCPYGIPLQHARAGVDARELARNRRRRHGVLGCTSPASIKTLCRRGPRTRLHDQPGPATAVAHTAGPRGTCAAWLALPVCRLFPRNGGLPTLIVHSSCVARW